MKKVYGLIPLVLGLLLAVTPSLAISIDETCPVGTQKYRSSSVAGEYVCVAPPSGFVTLPIETLGEAIAYGEQKVGVPCSGANYFNAHPEFDYPLSSAKSAYIECVMPDGQRLWEVKFKATDGQLWLMNCNELEVDTCPEDYMYPFPTPVYESTPEYFCNREEFYDYLRSIVNFAEHPDRSITYPDDYDLSSTLTLDQIKTRSERACYYTTGTPIYPYETPAEFGWTHTCTRPVIVDGVPHSVHCDVQGERGCACTTYVTCGLPRDGGEKTTVWGFIVNNDGHIVPYTPKQDLPLGRAYYKNGYGFTESGVCFRGCFAGTCEAPVPNPPNPHPLVHFSWLIELFQDFIANLRNAICNAFGIWCPVEV